ncbi:MAG: hypothetical protein SF029_00680 [bacterium]|nr:hypothetical protein [bacterium]
MLYPKPPYDLALLLQVLTRYLHPITDRVYQGAYWRALYIGDSLVLARVESTGTPDAPALDVYTTPAAVDRPVLEAALTRLLGLGDNFSAFFLAVQEEDATLWPLIEPLRGLRWPRTPTVFEALMVTIVEQQIAWTAAQKALRWLVEWGGNSIETDEQTFYAFPTPKQIAAATIETFVPLKITFRRMRLMIDIAQQVTSGRLDVERLREMPSHEAYAALTSIKGVGHWTASWTMTRALGAAHNYVGHNDVALQAAVNHYFHGGQGRKSGEQTIETFARYGDFAGLAAHYTILRWVLDRYEARSEG